MSDKPKPPREFEPIEDRDEALRLLREGARTASTAMIWTTDQEQVVNTMLNHYSAEDKSVYFWVPKELDPREFMDALAKKKNPECFFSVSLLHANIFFRTRLIGVGSIGLQFALPEKIFKVQRRKDLRIPIPDGYAMKAEFDDPHYKDERIVRKVIDISAGGTAIMVSENEEPIYQPGVILRGFTFTVRGRKIVVDVEVRHLRKLTKYPKNKATKVGVQFMNIRPGDAQHIAGYVFEECRKYFTRFL